MDFQIFRNNLHHDIKRNELQTVMDIIKCDDVEYYRKHRDYIKMFYLVATVDYISKKYSIPLCDKYNEIRKMKLEEPSGFIVTKLCSLFNDSPYFQAYTLAQYQYTVRICLNVTLCLICLDLPYNVHLSNDHLTDKHFFSQKLCPKHAQNAANRAFSGGKL